jgi:hypothetical protein
MVKGMMAVMVTFMVPAVNSARHLVFKGSLKRTATSTGLSDDDRVRHG